MSADPEALARRVGEVMWADDKASRSLGMELVSIGRGRATLGMIVSETMVNGLGVCHGGFVFTLADSACAFASNSYNERAILQTAQVTLLAPARLGMRLVAEAAEQYRGERTGIYDVTVRARVNGEVIAEFRGMVRKIPGSFVPER